ncbi:MAG: GNAT family N-acetyltransferase [Acidobacteriota bacterium]
MDLTVCSLAERPDLRRKVEALQRRAWPLFMWLGHDEAAERYWSAIFETFAAYQICFLVGGKVIAASHSLPYGWDGSIEGLPAGWDDSLVRGFDHHRAGRAPNTLGVLSMVLSSKHQGQGLSGRMVQEFVHLARRQALDTCIVPVRPTLKHQHLEMAIEDYVAWRRDDGLPWDPWLRVHARLGAETLAIAHASMTYTGTLREWESWTRLKFPESGSYPITGGLVPLEVDRDHDRGTYVEPNVWVRHRVAS